MAAKVSAAGGRKVLRTHSSNSPEAYGEAPGGAGCPPAAHGSHMEQISTLQSMEEPGEGRCGLEDAAAHVEPPQEQAPGRSCSPWRGAHAGAGVWRELPPVLK